VFILIISEKVIAEMEKNGVGTGRIFYFRYDKYKHPSEEICLS
jgi:hypothetical protein